MYFFSSAADTVSGAYQIGGPIGVRPSSVRLSVVNNSFESLLLLQFSTNLNQTWHKVRTPRGAKIVGSGILNFCFVWEKADDFVIFQQFIQIATPPTVLNQS